ncbi:MAG: Quinolinate phosphoribosyltransferase [decarboxylating] [uncultured Thermomicrobiales bacterium]|uniref:nicotinate-nucleotide diphosphorylase (carboxylating) n=1 Tax=uncultured Thermomicrobiales bacterium TaxID=1645740 RepID=A0A6J4VBV9_9BACT|nr:MAG: Quinolinate phosphoribosyltransferase [decarboxylating] [uncultured Thermomicrobiales bacterium]
MTVAERHHGWEAIVDLALAEDIGTGDITTLATVPAGTTASGVMLAKDTGVISGIDVARFVFGRVDGSVAFEARVRDGDPVRPGTTLAHVRGPARAVLTAERTALNLIQRLSGVATTTAR